MANLMKVRMQECGKTSKDLAKEIGISEVAMSFMLNGHVLPTREKLKQLCEALDCDPLEIYEVSDLKLLGKSSTTNQKKTIGNKVVNERAEGAVRLFFWINEHEKVQLFGACKALGYRTITEWLREMMRNTIARYQGSSDR